MTVGMIEVGPRQKSLMGTTGTVLGKRNNRSTAAKLTAGRPSLFASSAEMQIAKMTLML